MPTIHQHMTRTAQVPAKERKVPHGFLGEKGKRKRESCKNHWNVLYALMIRDEDIGPPPLQPIEAFDRDADPGRPEDERRPRARTPVREVPAAGEQARHN